MQRQHKSSSHLGPASVFFLLYHPIINFITIAIGRTTCFLLLFFLNSELEIDCRDALVTSTINCATSLLAGFVVFSTLGHMANVSKKSVEQVIQDKGLSTLDSILNVVHFIIHSRFGIGFHCLSTYNCIDELVNIMGNIILFHVDYIRH